jgi:hypothetical protein
LRRGVEGGHLIGLQQQVSGERAEGHEDARG